MKEELESAVEVPFGVAAAAVVAAAVVILGAKMGLVLWWKPRRMENHFLRQGIGGPRYRFFIGNFKELVSMMAAASSHPMPKFSHNILPRVLSFYHHWKKIYGSTFLIWFGPIARVAVSDPDMIREIFITNSHLYEKNEAHPLVKQLEGDGLLTLNGPKWALHRKIISPTFHSDNIKLLIPLIEEIIVEMVQKWSSMAEETTLGGVEIDVFDSFQTLTEDVITKTAFGCSYEDGKAIFKLQTQQMILASEAFQKVFIPGYRFLPTRTNMKSWKLEKEIKKSLIKLIEGRKRNFEKNWAINEKGPKDLLGLMIQASISVHDIVEECKSFFFAGKQTTSNLLTWTTVLLAMHPQWQILARHEVFTICGPRALPSPDDVSKFKILSMILNESLRLYPPTVATIRRANADMELGGRMIPRGTEFLIPILAVHHDQTIWGNDASEFNPERFSDGVSRAGNHPVGFIPFGLGVRNCIGQNLAILEAKLAMVIILQRLSFRLAPTYQHAPTVLMLLYPQYGAPILFEKIPLN
ncbi:cytochrome P450 734A1-like [Cucurbita maxima]|uniref:Cytochrome P450 734A1-like n=1 Tax=Cucurbita maxima TaxID=3661 RepID=A0A6J1JHK6_CUCMA|nr:cytochrome P450 734A1-like [Cucurbita maxima]